MMRPGYSWGWQLHHRGSAAAFQGILSPDFPPTQVAVRFCRVANAFAEGYNRTV